MKIAANPFSVFEWTRSDRPWPRALQGAEALEQGASARHRATHSLVDMRRTDDLRAVQQEPGSHWTVRFALPLARH